MLSAAAASSGFVTTSLVTINTKRRRKRITRLKNITTNKNILTLGNHVICLKVYLWYLMPIDLPFSLRQRIGEELSLAKIPKTWNLTFAGQGILKKVFGQR